MQTLYPFSLVVFICRPSFAQVAHWQNASNQGSMDNVDETQMSHQSELSCGRVSQMFVVPTYLYQFHEAVNSDDGHYTMYILSI